MAKNTGDLGYDKIPQNSHFTEKVEVCICTYLTQIRKLDLGHPHLALRRAQNLTQIRKLDLGHPLLALRS